MGYKGQEDAQGLDKSHTSRSLLFEGLTQPPPGPDLGQERTVKMGVFFPIKTKHDETGPRFV